MSDLWPPLRLLDRLAELSAAITETQLQLTKPKLGNPKYAMDRRRLTDKLENLQNQKIGLLQRYVEYLGAGDTAGMREGNWIIQITHVGPSEERTARAKALIDGSSMAQMRDPWIAIDHEVERAMRSIDHLEGQPERPRRSRDVEIGNAMSLMQDDMAELLRVLGIGDHARPVSPHEVMQKEIIPRVRALEAGY